jgi:hypothetical protein
MNRVFRSVLTAALAGALPFALALWFVPGRQELALDVYMLLIAAAAVYPLARALGASAPPPEPEPTVGRRRSLRRLPELERTERAVLLSASTAFDAHYRLRPILREIAAQRLATRRGLSLDHDVDASRLVVGEPAWELVRPDREPPHVRHGPGVGAAELSKVVSSLERI